MGELEPEGKGGKEKGKKEGKGIDEGRERREGDGREGDMMRTRR